VPYLTYVVIRSVAEVQEEHPDNELESLMNKVFLCRMMMVEYFTV